MARGFKHECHGAALLQVGLLRDGIAARLVVFSTLWHRRQIPLFVVAAGAKSDLLLPDVRRWLGMASYLAGLAAVCLGFHSVWGVQSLGGMQGAWVLTSGVALVFLGISSESMRDLVGKRSKAVGQHQKAA